MTKTILVPWPLALSVIIAAILWMMTGSAVMANPEYAAATGRGCGTCHMDDRPPTRQTVMPTGVNYWNCHGNQTCVNNWLLSLPPEQPPGPASYQSSPPQPMTPPAYNQQQVYGPPPAQPGYQQPPAPAMFDGTTRTQGGMAKFTDNCGSGNSDYIIRAGGSQQNLIQFELQHGHKVHILVAPGSTFALNCGGFPDQNAPYQYIRLQ